MHWRARTRVCRPHNGLAFYPSQPNVHLIGTCWAHLGTTGSIARARYLSRAVGVVGGLDSLAIGKQLIQFGKELYARTFAGFA